MTCMILRKTLSLLYLVIIHITTEMQDVGSSKHTSLGKRPTYYCSYCDINFHDT